MSQSRLGWTGLLERDYCSEVSEMDEKTQGQLLIKGRRRGREKPGYTRNVQISVPRYRGQEKHQALATSAAGSQRWC